MKIARSSCEASVAPCLFEFSTGVVRESPPSEAITQKILESDVLFVLLSKAVEKFWIQAWIGLEIGIAHGSNTSAKPTDLRYHEPQRIIVLQNIKERLNICIPRLDDLVLFNFTDEEGWEQYKNLVAALTLQGDTFTRGNRFRESFMQARIDGCKCKSQYQAWVAIRDAKRLAGPCKRISKTRPAKAELTIDCPSCKATVSSSFTQGL